MATTKRGAGGVIHEQCGSRSLGASAFILRHNWSIWPRGEGHAVAVFCVEGPLRGRRFSAARQRIWGSARYLTLNFASLASQIEDFDQTAAARKRTATHDLFDRGAGRTGG